MLFSFMIKHSLAAGLATLTPPALTNPTGYTSLADFLRALVDILQPLAGVIFVVTIMIGGYQYMTAGGSEENVGKARRTLLWGTIGAIIVFTAKPLINYLIGG